MCPKCFHQICIVNDPLKDKKGSNIPHGSIEIVNESKRKSNELWVDQAREF